MGVETRESSPHTASTTARSPARGGPGIVGDDALLENSVVWGNDGPSLPFIGQASSRYTVTYSCVQGEEVPPGEGNLNTDPLLSQTGL